MNNQPIEKSSDFDAYHPDHVPLFEAIYGDNLISLGGLAAVDNMFVDLSVRGLKALDLGFGLGGMACYLAEHYDMTIAGIELYPWMVDYATKHCPPKLADKLEFNTYDSKGRFPYQPDSFDLVYSKGVLNHVADKNSLFKQVHTALKPLGMFVITDWIFPKASTESIAPLVSETKASYGEVLLDTGFSDIHFRDDSKLFLNFTKDLLVRLANNQALIEQKYGEELYLRVQQQHEELLNNIQEHQKIATRIVARKE